jgi:hypothetical protein
MMMHRLVNVKKNTQFSGHLALENSLYFLQHVIYSRVTLCNLIFGHQRIEEPAAPNCYPVDVSCRFFQDFRHHLWN